MKWALLWLGLAGPALAGPALAGPACQVPPTTVAEHAALCAQARSEALHQDMWQVLARLADSVLPEGYDARLLHDSQAFWEVQADATCGAVARFYGDGLLARTERYRCLGDQALARRDLLRAFARDVAERRGLPPE